jgi:hypothetical protein
MRGAGHVASMGELRNSFKILADKSQGKYWSIILKRI